MIKLVAFDVGGVLQESITDGISGHNDLGIHHFMAKKLKLGLDTWFDSIDVIYAKAMEGEFSKKKAMSLMSKNLKIKSGRLEKLFIQAYEKYFKKNKKLYKIALKLKNRGYKIAILSDQWPVSKEALIKKEDAKKFDIVIISCDVGLKKPSAKIYRFLMKKAKLKANEMIFIDNRRWNLDSAKKLGIKTILFKNNRQVLRELNNLKVKIE